MSASLKSDPVDDDNEKSQLNANIASLRSEL